MKTFLRVLGVIFVFAGLAAGVEQEGIFNIIGQMLVGFALAIGLFHVSNKVGGKKGKTDSFKTQANKQTSEYKNPEAEKPIVTDKLSGYKDLVDQGLITEEDFETKKIELLK